MQMNKLRSRGLSASTKWEAVAWIPVAFGLSGAFALLIAAGTLIRESRLAVRGAEVEIEYVQKVVARKTTVPLVHNEKPEGGQGEG